MTSSTPFTTAYAELSNLVHGFYNALDEFRYADMGAAMAPQGVWHRQGKDLQGPAQVVAELEKRPRSQHMRHVLTNFHVPHESANQATVRAYMMGYRFDDGTTRAAPVSISGPGAMLIMEVRCERGANGQWQIADMKSEKAFDFMSAG